MGERSMKTFAATTVLAILVAACGQKPGVHQDAVFGGIPSVEPSVNPTTGETTFPTIDPIVNPTTGETITPTVGPTGGSSGPVTGGGDRTGITDTTITIGVHAPTSGAAPIEAAVFEKGADVYWKWLKDEGKSVLGRQMKVVFENDNYNPVQAVAVCKKMAETNKAFLLIGGAGSDQIRACAADYAAPRNIPYLSAGVQEVGLSDLPNYFAVTMSYKAQMAPLVQLLKKLHAKSSLDKYGGLNTGDGVIKVAFIRPNTPNFDDADAALESAVKAAGWTYRAFNVPKDADAGTGAGGTASNLKNGGYDIAIPITAPTYTAGVVSQADKNAYKPLWAGVAISNNVNAMIDIPCRVDSSSGMGGAVFLSPWPGLLNITDPDKPLDRDFVAAAKKYAPSVFNRKYGDLLYALWGIMRSVHKMFENAGPAVTRESFASTNRNGFSYRSGQFPTLGYTTSDPFGAKDANVLLGKCTQGGNGVYGDSNGAQWITHPDYPGLRSSF